MECGTRKAFGPASADISAVLGDLLADGDREKPLILDGLYLAGPASRAPGNMSLHVGRFTAGRQQQFLILGMLQDCLV